VFFLSSAIFRRSYLSLSLSHLDNIKALTYIKIPKIIPGYNMLQKAQRRK
jgi:hypothetical protein